MGLTRVSATLPGLHLGHAALVPTEIGCDVVLKLASGEPSLNFAEDFWGVWCALGALGSLHFHGFYLSMYRPA